MLPEMVFGCLRQAVPERVPGTSCLWNIVFRGSRAKGETTRYGFAMTMISNGGTGARTMKDGLSATAFPPGAKGTLVEIAEASSPVLFWRKKLRPDSGGAGRTRGGMGQMIAFIVDLDRNSASMVLSVRFDGARSPPNEVAHGGTRQR
jgi:N-methylhydantoinase B